MNILVIIDPQNDFISGSLFVPKAREAMDNLILWIQQNTEQFDEIFITMDQHPYKHCSFVAQGGTWPVHCVRYTEGAAIYSPLIEAIFALGKPISYIEKGTNPKFEEYSAFSRVVPEKLLLAKKIYIAGIAGDYCVAECLKDLERAIPVERIVRLEEAIPYIHK